MKMPNKYNEDSYKETVISIHDACEEAFVESSQLPIMRLLREICEGPTGRMIKDLGDEVRCAIDKRHISLNEKAYSPRKS